MAPPNFKKLVEAWNQSVSDREEDARAAARPSLAEERAAQQNGASEGAECPIPAEERATQQNGSAPAAEPSAERHEPEVKQEPMELDDTRVAEVAPHREGAAAGGSRPETQQSQPLEQQQQKQQQVEAHHNATGRSVEAPGNGFKTESDDPQEGTSGGGGGGATAAAGNEVR